MSTIELCQIDVAIHDEYYFFSCRQALIGVYWFLRHKSNRLF